MTGWPRALEPWRPSLEKFAPELQGALAPLVQRLSLAIGPLHAGSRVGAGEPDGYDGLARRGLYERLLASEWLLASELPEEFLRRASSGEHAFLQLASRVPAGGKRSIALFDAGPAQLGTPRIAHIAALIVLAHRAEKAGVKFCWGLLQSDTLVDGLSEANLRVLLDGRTREPARPHQYGDEDEVWTIGAIPWGRRSIVVDDVLDPSLRQLAVTVRRESRTTELRLELPSDADCTRLLRDPFGVFAAPPDRSAHLDSRVASNPIFSLDGKRVIVRLADGSIAVFPIPTSQHATPGRPGRFRARPGETIIAAGGRHSHLFVATSDRATRVGRLLRIGKRGGIANELATEPAPPTALLPALGPMLGTLMVHMVGPNYETTLCDAAGFRFSLDQEGFRRGHPITALSLDGEKPLWVITQDWQRPWKRLCRGGGSASARWESFGPELGADGPAEAFIVSDQQRSQVVAAVRQDDRWAFLNVRPETSRIDWLHPSGHERVVGARANPPSLLLLDQGKRSLSLVSQRSSRTVLRTQSEIVHAAMSFRGSHAAAVTTDGQLLVVVLSRDEVVLRISTGAA